MRGDVVFRVYGCHEGRERDYCFGPYRSDEEARSEIAKLQAREMNGGNWAAQHHNNFVVRPVWSRPTSSSFVRRHLSRGASFDEVRAAVGHSSPVVTKRFYDRYVRRSFSPKLRAGLGLVAPQQGGRIAPMRKSR